jgi:hypothetical protein
MKKRNIDRGVNVGRNGSEWGIRSLRIFEKV